MRERVQQILWEREKLGENKERERESFCLKSVRRWDVERESEREKI